MALKKHHKWLIGSFSSLILIFMLTTSIFMYLIFVKQEYNYQVLNQKIADSQADTRSKINELAENLHAYLYLPAMPIQDAIDLAHFLVDAAAKFSHFSLRPATVGGPIEIATITKHEGYKWCTRKHYFSAEFNREG